MEFDLDADQRALRDAARAFLERETPVSYARAMMDDAHGYREEVWRKMADLGWMALPFPEEAGGVGQGFVALAILLSEMGRVVLPGPYFSTVVPAGHAILEAGSDAQRKEILASICSGEVIAAFVPDADVRLEADTLTGEARYVSDAPAAHRFVVATVDGLVITNGTDGITLTPVQTLDATRKVAHVTFQNAGSERLEGSPSSLQRILDRASVGLAAEMLGAAERVVELAVEYAKQRVQFDRPIGSFQAVKHRAADMHLDVESLRNAVYYAAWAVERDHPDASLAASMAKAYASDAFRRVAAGGIQVHGGIGFTWEHDMHLYFKRAKESEVAFGSADFHRERTASLLQRRYGAESSG
jgi:alkylation response protein AidB-like acyl-CoA dehydrogenase